MKSLAETIRDLRVARRLLLREVAAELCIDPSLLSRIEHGEKRPRRDQVIQLAKILECNADDLLLAYLSDRVVYELQGEKLALKAVQIAENKIRYSRKSKKSAR